MDFSEVVRRRRMVRNYLPKPVADEVLNRIVESARRGPSAGFTQGVSFVVLTAAGDRQAVAQLCGEEDYIARGFPAWLSNAPVHVVVCVSRAAYEARYAEADKQQSTPPGEWSVPFWWVDGGAALMLLLLATTNEGLAAGFQQLPDTDELRDLLGLEADELPLGLVTIGHGDDDRGSASLRRGRRPASEQIRFR